MQRIILLIALVAMATIAGAQENCANGIDDDGDGLIDLQDTECSCYGLHPWTPADQLPNPSFEENCVARWAFPRRTACWIGTGERRPLPTICTPAGLSALLSSMQGWSHFPMIRVLLLLSSPIHGLNISQHAQPPRCLREGHTD